jgi:hypothetical protein
MGAWGDGPWENDAALDALSEAEAGGVERLREALRWAAETPGDAYLDVDDGASALAAAEVFAAVTAPRRERLPARARDLADRVAASVGAEDLSLARRAVERVIGPSSELASLWAGHGADSPWHRRVRALLADLPESSAPVAPPDRS